MIIDRALLRAAENLDLPALETQLQTLLPDYGIAIQKDVP